MEVPFNRFPKETPKTEKNVSWISTIDLEDECWLEFDEEVKEHCLFSLFVGNVNGYKRFTKRFSGLARKFTAFQEETSDCYIA